MQLAPLFKKVPIPTLRGKTFNSAARLKTLPSLFNTAHGAEEDFPLSNDELLDLPPAMHVDTPPDWQEHMMPFKGRHVPCYISRAENEECVVGFVSGMSSSPLNWQDEIAALNAKGISVVAIALYHTKKPEKYHKVNLKLLQAFFQDDNSPLYQLFSQDLGRAALLHSTASPLFLNNISRKGALRRMPEPLNGAVHLNSFFDTIHSSWRFGRVMNAVHMPLALLRRNYPVGTSRLERAWSGAQARTEEDASLYGLPHYSRVIYTRSRIRRFNEMIWAGQRADISGFRQTMLLGGEDQCVCNITARSIAKHSGISAEIIDDADHFNIGKNSHGFSRLAEALKENAMSPFELAARHWQSSDYGAALSGFCLAD